MNSSSKIPDQLDLPHEIMLLIAKQLDAFSLILFSSTSKYYWQLLSPNELWEAHFFEAFNHPPCLQACLDLQKKPETFYRNSFFRKKGISKISDSVIDPYAKNSYFNIQLFGKNAFQLFHQWSNNKTSKLDLNYSDILHQKKTNTFSYTIDFSEQIQNLIPDFPLKNLKFLSQFKAQTEKSVYDFFESNLNKPNFTLPIQIINTNDTASLTQSLQALDKYRLSYFLIDLSDSEDLEFASNAMKNLLQNSPIFTSDQRECFYLIGIHDGQANHSTHSKTIHQLTEALKINFISVDLNDPQSDYPAEHFSKRLFQTLKNIYTPSDFSQTILENESELKNPQIRQ